MFKSVAVLALGMALFLVAPSKARKFDECSLAQTLVNEYGFAQATIGQWVCLAYYESSWDTSKVGGPNGNGSFDYGLFQINDYYWCYPPDQYADCDVACNSLVNDDISDDVTCAKKIYARHGFDAWYGWLNNCQGSANENYDWVAHCF